jgi:hypothetical protein
MNENSNLISASGKLPGGTNASTGISARPDLATARKALRARLIEARRACSTTIHQIDTAIRAINLRTRPSLPLGEAMRAIDELEREALVNLPNKGPAIKPCHPKAGDVGNEP